MSRDEVLAQLKKDVRSLLISSKLGLQPQQLCQDYMQMLGHPMPLKLLGYRNVMHFVHDVPDVVSVLVTPGGNVCLKAVCDESTKKQAELVTKQRLSKADRSSQRRGYSCFRPPFQCSRPSPIEALHRRFRSSPVMPPDLRTQIHHLLSKGPVRLVELEWAYLNCFGFPLCVNKYGFLTKEEMVMAASNFVSLQHGPYGSVLTLKPLVLPKPLLPPSRGTRPWKPRLPPADIPSIQEPPAERLFGEDVPLKQCEFVNIINLTDNLSDVFHVKRTGGDSRHQWITSDIEGVNNTKTEHSGLMVPMDAVLSQRLKAPTRHSAREMVEVLVEEVVSPGHFYIRFICSDETNKFEEMMIDMRRCYRCPEVSKLYCLPEQFVRPGQVCCLSPAGWWFYRVVIHQVFSSTQVEVYYVDFGILSVVHTTDLKFLKCCYAVLPAQAVPSTLAGITPTNGHWTAEALACFRQLCFDRILVGLLDQYVGDVLQLYLCDTNTAEDVYSHTVLTRQGHAKACSSAALSPRVTPVGLHLGNGLVDLPDIQAMKILTPQPWELQEEEVDLPSLELIE
ncbi:tudor domain-containing protein 5 [Salarias fasciatus]|uniref:tudor domain-containing protein 5 n=1 Tax=Salarias fasciatus TaxID=181472 RepID=UPI001176C94A|nr:tudor domain-containing protein 5 [Salarias fasciatus]